jgi:outer membrane lipoprotein-sorting protein
VRSLALLVAAGLLAAAASGAEPESAAGTPAPEGLEAAPPDVEARALAQRAEDALRSAATYLQATLTIVSPRLAEPRVVALRSWDDRGNRRSLIRVLAPPEDAGTSFLKLHPNLWMHVPRLERTQRIPPSMLLQPWMGSDFRNDDLLHASSPVGDYDHELLGLDPRGGAPDGLRAWVVDYRPREGAPALWGRIRAWIEVEHGTPLRMDYYDTAGARVRELRFDDVRQVQSRRFPHRWTMTPLDKKGRETRLQVEEVRFDQTFEESIFTTRQLGRRD